MPTVNLFGLPVTMTDAQYQQWLIQQGKAAPAPAPKPVNTNTLGKKVQTTGTTDPCTALENAKKFNLPAATLDALSKKCQAYREAQAFAQPSMEAMAPSPEGQLEPAGMSKTMKIAIFAGAAIVVVGGLAWYASR